MSFLWLRAGPLNVAAFFIFLVNLGIVVASYYIYKSKWTIQYTSNGWVDLSNQIHLIIVFVPIMATTFFSFISSFIERSGEVNAKCLGAGLAVSALYGAMSYLVERESGEIFFGPALVLLPALYGLVFMTAFFALWIIGQKKI